MVSEEELWQAYNEQGEPISGEGLTKAECRAGALHAAAHVWIYRGEGEGIKVLLQRRAKDKATWPGYYDISAAGHVDLDETPLQAAIRETKEELGHDADQNELHLLFVRRDYLVAETSGIIENEWRWVYALCLHEVANFVHADGEVDSTSWVTVPQFEALITSRGEQKIVPQGEQYFSSLLHELRTRSEA